MLEVDIAEAQQRLPELIDAARRGTEVYLTERGRRVARIVSVVPPLGQQHFGSAKGMLVTADDFAETPEDFADYLA